MNRDELLARLVEAVATSPIPVLEHLLASLQRRCASCGGAMATATTKGVEGSDARVVYLRCPVCGHRVKVLRGRMPPSSPAGPPGKMPS
jgi:DNA-directed RNA polymerase subunit RPC12/RpoP